VTDETTACESISEITISVTGGQLSVSASATPAEICIGESTTLMAIAGGGTGDYTFTWTSDPPGFTSDLQSPVVIPTETTEYFIDVNDGLSVMTSSIMVIVYPLPMADPGMDQTIPYGSSTSLSGSASGGSGNYNYMWTPGSLLQDPNIQNPITHNLYENTQFKLVVTDNETGCISEEAQVFVNLDGGPLNVVVYGESEICFGESTTLTASVSGGDPSGYEYSWTDDQGNNLPSQSEILVEPEETTVYTVSIDDGFNITGDSFTLSVNPSPEFYIAEDGQLMACPYDSIILSPNISQSGWSYLWSNGSTEESMKIGSSGAGYDVQTYSLLISSEHNCTFTNEVLVIFDFSACTGIDDPDPEPIFNFFPNPTDGTIYLQPAFDGKANISITDIYGNIFFTDSRQFVKDAVQKIEINNVEPGIYVLTIFGKDRKSNMKIVIF